jgi:hypothetical protein
MARSLQGNNVQPHVSYAIKGLAYLSMPYQLCHLVMAIQEYALAGCCFCKPAM